MGILDKADQPVYTRAGLEHLTKYNRLDDYAKSLDMLGRCNFIAIAGRGIMSLNLDPSSVAMDHDGEALAHCDSICRLKMCLPQRKSWNYCGA